MKIRLLCRLKDAAAQPRFVSLIVSSQPAAIMSSVLFVKTSSLGDVIHHMPVVADIRRHDPEAIVSWLVEEAYAPLVRLHPRVNHVIPVATRRWRSKLLKAETWREMRALRSRIRQTRYDAVLDTQGLIRSAILARMASGPSHGYDRRNIREPLASALYDVRHQISRDEHVIDRNRLLAAHALGYTPVGDPDYGLESPQPSLRDPRVIFFHATARTSKQWPVSHWIELGKLLAAGGLEVIVPWGTEEERSRSKMIGREVPGSTVPERRPIVDFHPLIASAALVVGVDTGLMHFAAALQTPLIGIFTDSDSVQARPRGKGPIAVFGGRGQQPSVREVFLAAERMI
jgi:heptosyltransferase-1